MFHITHRISSVADFVNHFLPHIDLHWAYLLRLHQNDLGYRRMRSSLILLAGQMSDHEIKEEYSIESLYVSLARYLVDPFQFSPVTLDALIMMMVFLEDPQ